MSDTTLNRFIASGTTAERVAFTPDPPTPASGPDQGYVFFDTDDGILYAWNGAAWESQAGPTNQRIAQVVSTETGAVATGSTTIPFDDSIPQSSEGDEYMTLAITPTSATNKLRIDVTVFATADSPAWIATALFQDSGLNALAVQSVLNSNLATGGGSMSLTHHMTAGTTSSTTFKVRIGGSAGTLTFNGQSTGRKYGGALTSSITITEIKV